MPRRRGDERGRHAENQVRQDDGGEHPGEGRDPDAGLEHHKNEEQRQNRDGGNEGREERVAEGIVDLWPSHRSVSIFPA